MRLEWVQRRLQEWAAWVEDSRGYVKPMKLSDTPGGGAVAAVPKTYEKEMESERTIISLYFLEKSHVSAKTLALVYLHGPRAHKTSVAEIARWLNINEKTLLSRLERAEAKFANMVDSAKERREKSEA